MNNKSKGQILPLVALTVLVLSMFFILMWNVGMIEYNRQKAQTAADAAAISAVRCRAAFYNTISKGHKAISLLPAFVWHNGKKAYTSKNIQGVTTPITELLEAISIGLRGFNQGMGGATIAVGNAAASMNGAKALIWPKGLGTRLVGRDVTVWTCADLEIVDFPPFVLPLPPYEKKKIEKAYYCRTWNDSVRNTQPINPKLTIKYTVRYPADDSKLSSFGGSLIGIGTKLPVARAVANAELYLNVQKNAKYYPGLGALGLGYVHNGGFPRNKSEGSAGWVTLNLIGMNIGGIEPASAYPMFEARITSLPTPFMH